MEPPISNLDKLTDKIYTEGIEKAQSESEKILNEAEKRKEQLIGEAEQEAEQIIQKAKTEADRLRLSVENDIQLKGRQLIHNIKQEINRLIKLKILDKDIKEAYEDKEFISKLILELAGYWRKQDLLELTMPSPLKQKFETYLKKEIPPHLNNLTINFDGKMEDGLRIGKAGDSFEITFGEQEFKDLFGEYLTDITRHHLFDSNT